LAPSFLPTERQSQKPTSKHPGAIGLYSVDPSQPKA
jgi:hypothetical protein